MEAAVEAQLVVRRHVEVEPLHDEHKVQDGPQQDVLDVGVKARRGRLLVEPLVDQRVALCYERLDRQFEVRRVGALGLAHLSPVVLELAQLDRGRNVHVDTGAEVQVLP